MIYHFILNPKSGKKRKDNHYEKEIVSACELRKLDYRIYYTESKGDATTYVREMIKLSPERQRFICVGGDGTINEIVNSAPANPNVEFGVIPGGSGNDFVRNFTCRKLFQNISAQIDGETMSLDLIRCNDTYCVNMVNIGFDCAVDKEAIKLKKTKLVSPGMSYIFGVVVVLFQHFGTKMKITFDDGEVIDHELLLTAIGNGQYCGGGFDCAPHALLQDGLMDVCVVDKITRLKFISMVSKYKKGTFLKDEKIMQSLRYRQVPHFRMEFEESIPVCIDGEIKTSQAIDFSVVKDGVQFVIPKGCSLKYKKVSDLPN